MWSYYVASDTVAVKSIYYNGTVAVKNKSDYYLITTSYLILRQLTL